MSADEDGPLWRSREHDLPLLVVGVFGGTGACSLAARGLVGQLRLRGARCGGPPPDGGELGGLLQRLGGLEAVYGEEENVLYLCLESATSPQGRLWEDLAGKGDAAFLAGFGGSEIAQMTDLVLLFSICSLVLWLCPGAAPRVDAAALRVLSKLHDIMAHPQLAPALAEGLGHRTLPVLFLVYADVKFPFLDDDGPARTPAPRHLAEGAERALDAKWRACLKPHLHDGQRGPLCRLHRPCAAVVPGPFRTPGPEEMLQLGQDLEDLDLGPHPCVKGAGDAVATIASIQWPMDHFRARVVEVLGKFRAEPRAAAPAPEGLLASARQLERRVRQTLEPCGLLPPELAAIVAESAGTNGHAPAGARTSGKPSGSGPQGELAASLCRWAFCELLLSLGSSQTGIVEGLKAYRSSLQKRGACTTEVIEQQTRAATQVLQQHACAPLSEAAAEELARRCEDLAASRLVCRARSSTGRLCSLPQGHAEDHRSSFRPTRVCLCGKSQLHCADVFELPGSTEACLPAGAQCCRDANFLPFLPLGVDFVADPVLVSTSPRLAKPRSGQPVAVLPSALPDAGGFVALVAGPPVKLDPVEGSGLPGFGDVLHQMSRWRLPSSQPFNPSAPPRYASLGLEYVCPQGHRFFAPPGKNSGLVLGSVALARASRREKRRRERADESGGDGGPAQGGAERPAALPGLFEEGEYEAAPLCNYRMFVPCAKHGRKEGGARRWAEPSCVAQLGRVWIQTPPAGPNGELIEAAPRVCMADAGRDRGADGRLPEVICSGGKVTLPHDSLVQLVLPTSFLKREEDGSLCPLPSFWELSRSDAERCRLLPYTFWVSMPS